MYYLYNLIVQISWFHLKIVALFHPKIRLFVAGRKQIFGILEQSIAATDRVFWIHVASLGEYEQGLPIIERLKTEYPTHKILLTFFSPSGYEIKKNTTVADVVSYLPMDSTLNVKRFLKISHPELAIFVKYEIWPSYLRHLRNQKIPTLLISALFKKRQVYFKFYGGFMRKALYAFGHIFVQEAASAHLLKSIGFDQVSVSGDTRLDRVSEILERDNTLDFMQKFKQNRLCLVAGSTWPEDEALLIDYINSAQKNLKFVLAPHTLNADKILGLAGSFTKKTMLYSNLNLETIGDCDVLIVNHIGLADQDLQLCRHRLCRWWVRHRIAQHLGTCRFWDSRNHRAPFQGIQGSGRFGGPKRHSYRERSMELRGIDQKDARQPRLPSQDRDDQRGLYLEK